MPQLLQIMTMHIASSHDMDKSIDVYASWTIWCRTLDFRVFFQPNRVTNVNNRIYNDSVEKENYEHGHQTISVTDQI